MIDTQVDDDEELDDEEQKKRQQPIGKPIMAPNNAPGADSTAPQPPALGSPIVSQPTPPEVQDASKPPALPEGIGSPISSGPPAPRPQSEALTAGMQPGGKLATPTYALDKNDPNYRHQPIKHFFDTLAGSTKIGSAIEQAGGFGTQGHEANLAREQGREAIENSQIKQGEEERQANATTGNTNADADLRKAQAGEATNRGQAAIDLAEKVPVTINGVTYTIPQKDAAKLIGTGVTQAGSTQRNTDKLQAAAPLVKARGDLAEAQAALDKFKADPDNPQAARAAKMLELAQDRYNLAHKEFEYNYDPSGLSDQESAMLPHDDAGGAIPLKSPSAPTSQTRTRGQMAAVTMADEPKIFSQIDALSNKIGPGAGRWTQFWVNKGGLNDPDFAALDSTLHAYASGLAVTHFGARGGGQQYIKQMETELGEAQSPEDLKARMKSWDEKMAQYAKAAGVQLPGGGGAGPKPEPAVGTIEKGYQYLGGGAHNPQNWKKVPNAS